VADDGDDDVDMGELRQLLCCSCVDKFKAAVMLRTGKFERVVMVTCGKQLGVILMLFCKHDCGNESILSGGG
jgi:hypothetical protein